MAHDVYISCASEDKAVADSICATLENNNIRCWIAPRDILPGAKWAEAVANAIDESRVLVLILSSSSNNSPQVIREVIRATSKGIPIIPIRIDNVVPSKAMDFFVAPSCWLDAQTLPLEKHLQQLANTIQQYQTQERIAEKGIEIPEEREELSVSAGKPTEAIKEYVEQAEEVTLINAIAEARNEIVKLVNSTQQDVIKGDVSAIERLDQAYESMSELRQRISTIREKVKSSVGKMELNKLSEAVNRDLEQLEYITEYVKKAEIINRHVQTFDQIMESFATKQKSRMPQTELAKVYSRLESLKESVKSDLDKLGRGEATQPLLQLIQELDKVIAAVKIYGPDIEKFVHVPSEIALMRKSTLGRQGGSPEVPGGRVDLVHFSITSPSIVQPDYSFRVGIWAHLEKQRREVIRRAMEAAKEEEISITTQGPMKVEHGTVLTVRLKLEEFIVEPSEATILWEGEIGNTTFGVGVPKDAKRGRRVGIATIHQDGFQVAIIFFELDVGRKSTAVGQIKARVKHHRTAFASYASPDRGEVMKRIQGMQKASPELDIFVDVDALRSGQYWEREIRKIIPSRDVFYLFWSASASKSYWVDQEWRYALEKRGLHFIDPCPLVSPKEVPPPKELESLHFNDRWIFYEESTVAK